MTNAGWYPDPAGAPNTYRYWDGQSWSQMTTNNPPGGAPGAAPGQPTQVPPPGQPPQPGAPVDPGATVLPPQQGGPAPYGNVPPGYPGAPVGPGGPGAPGGYGGYGAQGFNPPPAKKGSGKLIGIVVAAVVVLALVAVGAFLGIRALTGDDDTSADDRGSEASESSSEESGSPSDGTSSSYAPTGVQCTGGSPEPTTAPPADARRVSGGGLSVPVVRGYTVDTDWSAPFTFADQAVVQFSSLSSTWASNYVVGSLPKDNGFESLEQAAEIVVQCMTTNDKIYKGFESRTDLRNESITVDGSDAHLITTEIRVEDPEVTFEGDVTTVVVVDTGDDEAYGLYIGIVPIGDNHLIDQQEQTLKRVQVE